jgi:hypothetical protein
MKSTKYLKHRRSKYAFRTRIEQGQTSSHKKGRLIPGEPRALADVNKALGREIKVARTAHTKGQWVFCELRP